ncbi:hypothetical protein V8E53_014597 [Lactarius tabidus]
MPFCHFALFPLSRQNEHASRHKRNEFQQMSSSAQDTSNESFSQSGTRTELFLALEHVETPPDERLARLGRLVPARRRKVQGIVRILTVAVAVAAVSWGTILSQSRWSSRLRRGRLVVFVCAPVDSPVVPSPSLIVSVIPVATVPHSAVSVVVVVVSRLSLGDFSVSVTITVA